MQELESPFKSLRTSKILKALSNPYRRARTWKPFQILTDKKCFKLPTWRTCSPKGTFLLPSSSTTLKSLQISTLNLTCLPVCAFKKTFSNPTKCFCGELCTAGGLENKKTVWLPLVVPTFLTLRCISNVEFWQVCSEATTDWHSEEWQTWLSSKGTYTSWGAWISSWVNWE